MSTASRAPSSWRSLYSALSSAWYAASPSESGHSASISTPALTSVPPNAITACSSSCGLRKRGGMVIGVFPPSKRKRPNTCTLKRSPTLSAERARDRAIVLLQLMKAASALNDEEGLSGRSTALRELQSLAAQYLEQR